MHNNDSLLSIISHIDATVAQKSILYHDLLDLAKIVPIYKIIHTISKNDDYNIKVAIIDGQSYGELIYSDNFYHITIYTSSYSALITQTILHELTHITFMQIFHNFGKPYNDEFNEKLFNDCIIDLQVNIANYLDLNHRSLSSNSTYQRGCQIINSKNFLNKYIDYLESPQLTECLGIVIQIFLSIYKFDNKIGIFVQNHYNASDEHAEIIARYIEVVSSDCYQNEAVISLIQPLDYYWYKNVDPII